jgi:hypothetical protein
MIEYEYEQPQDKIDDFEKWKQIAFESGVHNVKETIKMSVRSAEFWGYREQLLDKIAEYVRRLQDNA